MATDILDGVRYRSIGPTRGGRVVAVAADPRPREHATFYFGTTGGGVWKSTDAGQFWSNVSDGYFKRASVGALCVAPSDPNVLYAGMGETTIRGNVSHGDGVYKSTDAGKTWTHLGLERTRNIGRVQVHPKNPDLVYVAAFGHAHGPNPERGLYRSLDGGATWDLRLHRSARAGANFVELDPGNPLVLYVAFWEAERGPHYLSSGGPGSGIFKSTDGGDTFTELTGNPGLPQGIKGKIELAVSPARDGRVWAIVEADGGGVFRSDDGGASWEKLTGDTNLTQRSWYFNHIRADPRDPDTVWVLNFELWKSIDGGRTFQVMAGPHVDYHDLWIDPRDTRRMILGGDGGGCVSLNGGASWSTLYNQPTGEFYHVTVDSRTPYRVYGAQQDNTTMSVPSASNHDAITFQDWYEIGGGESGYIAVRPDNPDVVYAGSYQGELTRYDHATGQVRDITVWPESFRGYGAKDYKYRFQWTSPTVLSPHDPRILMTGANHIFRSLDEGQSWDVISPDLTRGDPETLQPSGGPITKDNTGAEVYGTVFTIAESPRTAGILWSGSDDGLVYVSRDNGASWDNATPADLPDWALISLIEASPHDPAAAYLAATRYKLDDFAPYLYKTSDYGKTWTKITNGIAGDDFTRVVRADPARAGLLYAGTETGVYVSFDDGSRWERLTGNLPVVPIHDLIVKDSDLVVGTHGRSFWILDDLTVLHQLKDARGAGQPRVFQPRETPRVTRQHGFGHSRTPGHNYAFANGLVVTFVEKKSAGGEKSVEYIDAGNNPPEGVLIHYWLPEKPTGRISLSVLDADGQEARSFTSRQEGDDPEDKEPKLPAEAGLNRFVWDMRYAPPVKIASKGGDQPTVAGPLAPPARYQLRLTIGDATHHASFELVPDPRCGATPEDLREQFDLGLRIRDTFTRINETVNTLRTLREQVEAVSMGMGTPATLMEAAGRLKEQLAEVEGELLQTKANSPKDTLNHPVRLNTKLARVAGAVASADARPTRQTWDVFNDLSARIDAQLRRFDTLLAENVPAFNALVRDAALPAVRF